MDDDFAEDMQEAYGSFGIMAERVIGHAFRVVPRSMGLPTSQEDAQEMGLVSGFVFCGLLSLIDPPRDAVPPAVEQCRKAGALPPPPTASFVFSFFLASIFCVLGASQVLSF